MSQCPLPEGATRNRPPEPEAGAYVPGYLPDVRPLAVRESFEMTVEHDIVDAKAYFALYSPEDPSCAEACGDWAFVRDGFELVRFWLPSEASAPCLLYLWCQVVLTFLGRRHVLTPPDLCPKTKRHIRLDQEIRKQLGSADVTTLMARTGLPRRHIDAIAKAFRKAHRRKLPGTAFRPIALGADFVAGGRSRAAKYPVFTLTASDPRRDEHIPLDFLRVPPGEGHTGPRSAAAQGFKNGVLSVNAEALLAIVIDGEDRLEKIAREGLRLATKYNPALKKVRLVLDRRHVQWNALKPLHAALLRTKRGLDKDDPEEKELRDLLKQARYDIEEAPDFAVEDDPKRRKRLARVFKHFPQLKPYYEAFNGIRRIYSCPGAESAALAFEVWWKGLSTGLRRSYGRFRTYVQERHWQMFLDYFAVKEETFKLYGEAYSVTTGFTEAMNREFKWRRKLARASSPDMLAARILSAFEYDRVRRRAALRCGRAARRAEKEAQSQQQSPPATEAGTVLDLAADADLAADREFLQSLTFATARPPDVGARAPG